MDVRSLEPYGWGDRWAALLAEHPGRVPGRVVRHDGSGLLLATSEGVVAAPLTHRLDPAPTVGDWIACAGADPVAVLPRTSLLRRASAGGETEQQLAANVDLVLLVCGLDRPVKTGRIERGTALARDAGATPLVVLTKAAVVPDPEAVAAHVAEAVPGVDVLVTSAREGLGLDALRALAADKTVTMLGESGAGKSSLVNALMGDDVAAIGDVRRGDAKGRHTTTTRELHVLPSGGVLIDSPGIRAVGLWVEPEAVAETFADIDELAAGCRFADCRHDSEPGCAVTAAVEAGTVTRARVDAWRELGREAEAAALRAAPHEQRRYEKRFARITKDAQRRKGR
ncbi:MAG TPA: ribosome small subunit-dependent GTPase A [Acidimicrobiales bacterium]